MKEGGTQGGGPGVVQTHRSTCPAGRLLVSLLLSWEPEDELHMQVGTTQAEAV